MQDTKDNHSWWNFNYVLGHIKINEKVELWSDDLL